VRVIVAIAHYTFREAVRNKILYSILFFAIVLIGLAVTLGNASVNQDRRFLSDIGLFSLNLFSDLIAMFLGITMVFQEIEKKTVYNLLSKPIDRSAYYFGKFAGIAFTLLVQIVFMAAVLTAVMAFRGHEITATLLYSYWLLWVESLIIAAFALLFGAFSTPYVSGFITLGFWLSGRLLQEVIGFLNRSNPLNSDATGLERLVLGFSEGFMRLVVQVAPDLSLFTLSTQMTYGFPVDPGYVVSATLYGLSYAAVALLTGLLIFRRRDFI
jgi:Cu-processing system permease protein